MTATLTKKQTEIYKYLREVQRAGEPAPSISEISGYFGFRSTRSARDHLKALERKGVIHRNANKARSIRVHEADGVEAQAVAITLLGSIPAGHPEQSEQERERFILIDSQSLGFTPTPHCYALHVTGDSMTGRGVYEGDIVIVDGAKTPRDGDMVAALIDNETTLKTLVKRNGRNYLKPENENYPDMIPIGELVIQGVVRTIIRKVC
jgi:repressor LexA